MKSRKVIRFLDIVLSLIILTIFSPVLIVVGILIFVTDFGPIFDDSPKRVGLMGKEFLMFKFRSMKPNSHKEMQENKYPEIKEKWQEQEKLPISIDPRITWIGKIIRRTDLDEMPQFINVLRGEMSIVGPRPFFKKQIDTILNKNPKLKNKYNKILKIKPGITGLWQVNGRNKNTIKQRINLDYIYSRNFNTNEYLKIIIKTPGVIISHIIKGE